MSVEHILLGAYLPPAESLPLRFVVRTLRNNAPCTVIPGTAGSPVALSGLGL